MRFWKRIRRTGAQASNHFEKARRKQLQFELCEPRELMAFNFVEMDRFGPTSSTPSNLTPAGTQLYFSALEGTTTPGTDLRLFRTDGTAIPVEISGSQVAPQALTAFGDTVFYHSGSNRSTMHAVYRAGATENSTSVFGGYLNFGEKISFGGRLYLGAQASSGTLNQKQVLYSWTGTLTAGDTNSSQPLNVVNEDVNPRLLSRSTNRLYFVASQNDSELQPTIDVLSYVNSSHVAVSTGYVANNASLANPISALTPVGTGDAIYFLDANVLKYYNGSSAPTTVTGTISGGTISNLTAVGNDLYFSAGGVLHRATNGAITTITGAPGSVANLTSVGNLLFFTSGTALWAANGSTATQINSTVNASNLTNVNGTLFFQGGPSNDRELWSSNGTTAAEYYDFSTSATGGTPQSIVTLNNKPYLVASSTAANQELWFPDTADLSATIVGSDLVVTDISTATNVANSLTVTINGTNVVITEANVGTQFYTQGTIPVAGATYSNNNRTITVP